MLKSQHFKYVRTLLIQPIAYDVIRVLLFAQNIPSGQYLLHTVSSDISESEHYHLYAK